MREREPKARKIRKQRENQWVRINKNKNQEEEDNR
jgi:hypothetical protein